ncbi:hypothetical protein OS493_029011 [Desmophyllum pertusum]|uniref:Uncharacterized protein n=1 Tax=Desmophyllum pertusum TaxID=174260 RepID=A0A9W9YWV0_9CNID|nr:hypothetical protein OS493_029011 [Desmophyllum pertusum]
MKFNLCSKLSFVLFACMFLFNQALGKPYEFQELDEEEQNFPEEKRELNQAVQNERSAGVRGKREVTYNLADFCHGAHYLSSPSANSCVKGWYYCYGYAEAVCNPASFQCLSSIPTYGYPKCTPVYDFVKIDLGSKGKRNVRRTKICHCAQ